MSPQVEVDSPHGEGRKPCVLAGDRLKSITVSDVRKSSGNVVACLHYGYPHDGMDAASC